MVAAVGPRDYYRSIAPVLLAQLVGRQLHALPVGATDPSDAIRIVTPPVTAEALLALVDRGEWHLLTETTDRIGLRLIPGEGSDIATAASATLQLAEQCMADGLAPVPLTDGREGLWLMARVADRAAVTAARYASLLTDRAPELATADPQQADGRSLLRAYPGAAGDLVPIPYTVLPRPGAMGAVVPLHLDEIAAIAAGMPAELTADDVAGRVADRGDLASALLGSPAR